MNWISNWIADDSVAAGLATLALAVTIGLFLGAIRVRGIKLGISGVLFSSLLFGQLGLSVDPKVLGFLRDFTLILFMYTIGLQVGPGFVSSLRAEGLRLNALAVAVLVLGALMTAVLGGMLARDAVSGLYTGAFTTTPGLAAAQEALRRAPPAGTGDKTAADQAGLAYTITYPFGVIGPVLIIPLLRRIFKVRVEDEKKALVISDEKRRPPIEAVDFEVTNPAYSGAVLRKIPLLQGSSIIFTRMLRDGVLSVPSADTAIRLNDVLRVVGSRELSSQVVSAMGKVSTSDLSRAPGDVQRMDIVVTRTQILRRPLRELDLIRRTGVTIALVNRAGVDLVPNASLRVAFADRVVAVGPEVGLKMVATELGNSPESLNRPQLAPIFLGIVLGVIVGCIPLAIPGLHTTIRIGLAGGPLLAAIALSQLGNIGTIVWYMPLTANQYFRDFGLAVFLACVGLQAGDHFIEKVASGRSIELLLCGACVTIFPVFIVSCFARIFLRMNFLTLSGWVAGAMTSSPTLLFAEEMAHSDAPAIAYAAVAPLATLVPIICAQMLAIWSM